MATLLPPKKQINKIPVATDDDHYEAMASDPSIPEIPQGSNFNSLITQSQQPQQHTVMTAAAETTAANNADVLVQHTGDSADWINKRWRPAMGWMYMAVCIFDFILFPIGFTGVQFFETQAANDAFRQWQPLTLQGGGLFHVAMGAVLGIAAYGRTKEKIEGKS